MLPRPHRSALFPYTTLFRSNDVPTLLRNDLRSKNRWLKIKTVGTRSNRTGLGARVRVVAGNHSQIDEVRSGGSYISQRSEEHTSELQSRFDLVCRLLLEKKK